MTPNTHDHSHFRQIDSQTDYKHAAVLAGLQLPLTFRLIAGPTTAALFNLENGVFSVTDPAQDPNNGYAPYPRAFLLPPRPGTVASSAVTRHYLRSILTLQYYLYGQLYICICPVVFHSVAFARRHHTFTTKMLDISAEAAMVCLLNSVIN